MPAQTVPRWIAAVWAAFASTLLAWTAPLPAGDFDLQPPSQDYSLRLPGRGVLLLRNGRLVEGDVSENAGGYVVELDNGRMMVPRGQVRYTAESADRIYRKLHATIPPKTPNAHLALAAWCATNELYDQARREVQSVLKGDPHHAAAKRMMKRIDEMLDPEFESKSEKPKTLEERLTSPAVTSLSGLSPKVARDFVGRIQPLLMNNCANSGCHGPRSENGFQLTMSHLRAAGRRGVSERNLASILRFVDVDRPHRSPLLTKPMGNHGRQGRPVFGGAGGAKQLAALRNWTLQVSRESEPSPQRSQGSRRSQQSTQQPPQQGSPRTMRVGQTQPYGPAANSPRPPNSPAEFGVRNPLPAYQQAPAMRALRSARRSREAAESRSNPASSNSKPRNSSRDPFDPDDFNRRFANPDANRSTTPPLRGTFP